ncbi:MAG: hypothetical protein DWQ08_06000 [Proteobacteria bacterium]|nr:MAG: hypothetical protein DWQ08_06000 [Pseudomonadota bacterium]
MRWNGGVQRAECKGFSANHVNALREMIARNLSVPHRFICVTDDSRNLDPDVHVVPLPGEFQRLGGTYPKLFLFSRQCRESLAERFLYIDLDTVIVGPLDPLLPDDTVDFMVHGKPVDHTIWELIRSRRKRRQRKFYRYGIKFNGAVMYMRAGAHAHVLERFSEAEAARVRRHFQVAGDDQLWVQHCLGHHEKTWNTASGIYSYGSDLAGKKRGRKPDNARIINFGGKYAPWFDDVLKASPWIRDYYPMHRLGR